MVGCLIVSYGLVKLLLGSREIINTYPFAPTHESLSHQAISHHLDLKKS